MCFEWWHDDPWSISNASDVQVYFSPCRIMWSIDPVQQPVWGHWVVGDKSVVCVCYSAVLTSKPAVDNSPQKMYAIMSFSYLGAMLCSNHALQFISYPTQVDLSKYHISCCEYDAYRRHKFTKWSRLYRFACCCIYILFLFDRYYCSWFMFQQCAHLMSAVECAGGIVHRTFSCVFMYLVHLLLVICLSLTTYVIYEL